MQSVATVEQRNGVCWKIARGTMSEKIKLALWWWLERVFCELCRGRGGDGTQRHGGRAIGTRRCVDRTNTEVLPLMSLRPPGTRDGPNCCLLSKDDALRGTFTLTRRCRMGVLHENGVPGFLPVRR